MVNHFIAEGGFRLNYVIIGGVAAGMSAAMEVNRTDKDAHITVLERGEIYSYGQCGLPYFINDLISSSDDLIARSVETFRDKYGIDARTNAAVRQIDTEQQVVYGYYPDRKEPFQVSYDRLLIASGSSPVFPAWEGSQLEGIYTLKTIPDAEEMKRQVKENVEDVTIVGGGYIGLEVAESLVSMGKSVTLIQRGEQLAKIFDADMAEMIHEKARQKGINLVLNEEVEAFLGEDKVSAIQTNKHTYQTDFVLLGIGVKPNTDFLHNSGVHVNKQGAVCVNPHQETNVKHVYAAGDCATNYHRVKQVDDHIPLGTTANKQGRVAGSNMAGGSLTFKGIVGTSIVKFFDLDLGRTGITEREAKSLQIPYHVQIATAGSNAGYYPGGGKMKLKILYHKRTNQLLGGQIIGETGVDKRIDVLATALYNEMTIHDLVDLDLSYAPPYNGVWDPIQKMARKTFND